MQPNQDALSTRDLASPSEPAADPVSPNEPAPDPASPNEPAPDLASPNEPAADLASPNEQATGGVTSRAEPASRTAEPGLSSSEAPQPNRPGDSQVSTANEPLLAADVSDSFQRHWEQVQTRFVDDPRGAVEDADGLVANVMQQLAEGFAQARERLEAQWGRGEDISTEDLRVSMQRYRSFFQRLLST